MSANDPNTTVLVQLGEVQGQLKMMTAMIQANHESTHQRINDFRHATEGRLTTVEKRLEVIEGNERGTALRGASSGAVAGTIVTAAIEGLKLLISR